MNETGGLHANISTASVSAQHLRLALTFTHLSLVCIGTVNLLVILLILIRPRYMRSITNVYMIGLCLADFIYLANLTLVAATQLKDKSWPFGSLPCTLYHGTETTGKYASVLFVVLLAADRYCAMCRSNWCARYRNYQTAISASILAWIIALVFALPLYIYADQIHMRFRQDGEVAILCIAKWPSSDSARWYISISSICLFAAPLVFIIFCYYHIINKLREAVNGSKRLNRAAATRAPYHRVTRLVLWVVIFHVICWSPFWLFNLFSSILRFRISTQFERIVVNIVHLFPYVNCALNPLLYAVHAENFRLACRSLFGCESTRAEAIPAPEVSRLPKEQSHYRSSNFVTAAVILPVDGERNYTIIKDKTYLDRPECPVRSLSDSQATNQLVARKEALDVVATSRISSSFSATHRLSNAERIVPNPSTWRKYSELEPRDFKTIDTLTPLIPHKTVSTSLLLLNGTPLEFESDTNL